MSECGQGVVCWWISTSVSTCVLKKKKKKKKKKKETEGRRSRRSFSTERAFWFETDNREGVGGRACSSTAQEARRRRTQDVKIRVHCTGVGGWAVGNGEESARVSGCEVSKKMKARKEELK